MFRLRATLWLFVCLSAVLSAQTPRRALDAISALPTIFPPCEICGNGIDDNGDTAIDEGCSTTPTCTFTLASLSASVGAGASTGSVAVTASGQTCAWTSTSHASWLTVGASGTGSQIASYAVAANTSQTARTGTLTIAGATFTVNQAGQTTPPPLPTLGVLFVDGATGSDARTKAQARFSSTPWRTIERAAWGSTTRTAPNAAEAAGAGDTVLIAGGTYVTSVVVNSRWSVVYNPVNNGTAANPITFTCVGTCILGAPNANAPVIGADGRTYIRWTADISQRHGWQIRAYGRNSGSSAQTEVNTAPDTGPVVCHGGTGCWIEGATIDGGLQVDYDDNWTGIRVEGAAGTTLRNNTIRNFFNASRSSNSVGIQIYGSANFVVEHNAISRVTTPISFKDTAGLLQFAGGHVRYNFAETFSGAGLLISLTQVHNGCFIYQNLFRDGYTAFTLARSDFTSNFWIFNNTFVNVTKGVTSGRAGSGIRFWNNIIATAEHMLYNDGATGPLATHVDFEHNVFYNATIAFFGHTDGTKSMAQWRTDYPGQDADPPQSIQADPLFVAPGVSGVGDFRLRAGSPAIGLGRDLSTGVAINAGAFITGTEMLGVRR